MSGVPQNQNELDIPAIREGNLYTCGGKKIWFCFMDSSEKLARAKGRQERDAKFGGKKSERSAGEA